MSKKKSKTQKKRFFAHPKNKNKTFKRKEVRDALVKVDSAVRKRGAFIVLPSAGCSTIPRCPHGPCLLFGEREEGKIKTRFFACAVYRSNGTACSFRAVVDDDLNVVEKETEPSKFKNDEAFKQKSGTGVYGTIPNKLKAIPKSSVLVFCHNCVDVFETKHKCPAEIVTRAQLRFPSRLLAAKESQTGEAQFFFSDETIGILEKAVERSGVDGVLCLGAPRLFEVLKRKRGENRRLFLLDYDERYAQFFHSSEFAQYSMLVDYFFDNEASGRVSAFFADCAQILLICDPPFGVFLEPLMLTFEALHQRYRKARGDKSATFYGCIVIPMFVGKYVLRSYKDYWMSDYRVTYDNHKVFAKASKTTVRCFTNLRPVVFDLSDVDGYRFCEFCEIYVSNANKHCFMCSSCTSKDGSPYNHCELCMRCVKKTYRHCKKCERCHLEGRCFKGKQISDSEE